MRRIIKYIFASILLLNFSFGCSNKDEQYMFGAKEALIRFESDTDILKFNAEGQTSSVLIKSNTKWSAKSTSDWIKLAGLSGEHNSELRFEISKNEAEDRSGQIIVTNTIGKVMCDTVTVWQLHGKNYVPTNSKLKLSSSIPELIPPEDFVDYSIDVESDAKWILEAEDCNWITILTKKGDGDAKASFIVSKNESILERTAFLKVFLDGYSSVSEKIKIKQAGRPFDLKIVSPRNKSVMVDENESMFYFTVKCDGAWSVSCDDKWVTIKQLDYEENSNVFVTVSGSVLAERVAKINIKSKIDPAKTDVLTLIQKTLPEGRMRDSLALIALYNSTNGENWIYKWKPELPLSESNWPGIFVDEINGELRVIDLSLSSFNLEGSLPNELGWLTQITKIKLQRNNLSGPIPSSIGKLVNLTHVYMSVNKLSGNLPEIPNLVNLTLLDLDFNRIEGAIPAEYAALPKLNNIRIKYNLLDPASFIPAKFWTYNFYINPQRRVYGDSKTDYNLNKQP